MNPMLASPVLLYSQESTIFYVFITQDIKLTRKLELLLEKLQQILPSKALREKIITGKGEHYYGCSADCYPFS